MNPDLLVLKTTVGIYAVIFGLGIVLTLAFRKTNWGRNMFVAILSWLGLFVIFVGTSFAGPIYFTALIALVTCLAVREYYVLNQLWRTMAVIPAVLLLGGMTYAVMAGDARFFYALPGIGVMFFFGIQLLKPAPVKVNADAALAFAGVVYWGWLMFHFALMHRLEHGFGYVVLLCSLIALNDNSAYFVGKLLGKRSPKMAPSISPGKTWVGAAGGTVATIIAAFLFRFAVPHLSWLQLGGLAVIVAIVVPMGDLIESAMKRDLGVKDSGTLIPGHGGALDRFDSWTFTVPVMYYYILMIT
jgi:phosphatidate cytidylyltransferase